MANKVDDREDISLDPGERHANELVDFENRAAFDDIEKNYDKNADPSQEDDNIDKGRQDAKNREENPMNARVTGRGNKPAKASGKSWFRKNSPIIALVGLLGGGGFSIFMFTGFLAPIAFFENVVDDLNDQLAAMDVRSTHIFRNKVSMSDRSEAVKGCKKLSIRCKFATMSAKQVAKLERAGFQVIPDENVAAIRELNGRVVPKEFRFRGETYSPREFAEALGRRGNPVVKHAFKRGLNMKYLGFSDKTFVGRTLKRFGVSRKPPELRGSHQDRVNALMTRAGVNDVGGLRFVNYVDESGVEHKDQWVLEGDPSGETYNDDQKRRMERSVNRVQNARPPTRMQSNAIKGLGILGAADLACSVKNMIGAAAVAAKVANAYQMVEYFMPIASLAGSQKASDISPEDSAALQEFFNQPDYRTHIPDINNAFEEQQNGEFDFVSGDIPMMENPNYGKSMMDSELYKLSSTGSLGPMSPGLTQYSLGMGQNRLLRGASEAANFMETMSFGGCNIVQNWLVRGASIIAGVALGVASGGVSMAGQLAVFSGVFIASITLERMLHSALSGDIVGEDIDQAPSDRAAIVWGGASEALGKTAQARGLIPGNAEQIVHYQRLQQESMADYTAIARQDADPFDIYDQHSFLGSFARIIGDKIGYSSHTSVKSVAAGAASLVTSTLPTLLSSHTTKAAPIDPARFKVCDDDSYSAIGIDADVQCNIRYFMPESDLALDLNDVNDYMESNGYVEIDEEIGESVTGLPEGYTPPDPAEAQSFVMGLVNGVVGSFYNDRNQYGDYGRFLDYCAYRAFPFGETHEEKGAFGAADDEWITGEKCMEDSEMLSNFRIYTLDKTVQEAADGEEVEEIAQSPVNESGEVVVSGVWAAPMDPGYTITSGWRVPERPNHIGTDFAAPMNTPYYAVSGGIVTFVGEKPHGTNYITIDHGDGIVTEYGHSYLDQILVEDGDIVRPGQIIGRIGNQGNIITNRGIPTRANGYGAHLHLNFLINGRDHDPVVELRKRGINV